MDKKSIVSKILIVLLGIIIIAMVVVLAKEYIDTANSPSKIVEKYFEAVKADDSEEIAKYYEGNSTEDVVEKAESIIGDSVKDKISEFEYEILSETIEGDKASVEVKLTTNEIGKAVVDALMAMGSEVETGVDKEFEDYLKEALEECQLGYEATVDITLTKKDGKWIIDEFEEMGEFMDALSGGLYSYLAQISNIFNVE